MNDEKLENYLNELKDEIGKLDAKNQEVAGKLRELTGSIEESLKTPVEERQNDELVLGIQNNIEHFESEHPTITGILDRITKALSSMGI